MNENLDLTKILEGCPIGTKFYHLAYGEVCLFMIDTYNYEYPIQFIARGRHISVTKDGKIWQGYGGECIVFPSKDQRDWSKFERFWDKPKVKRFDVNTLKPFDKVLVRADDGHTWRCGFVSHIVSDDFDKELVCTSDGLSVRCIPYNDETKHLLGTSEDCPEYYKWWEE